ncbi:hypothetical protein Tco_1243392 [Tanacetum coccineum]
MVKKHKRHPTPDPEWNTCKTNYDGPTQNWLSDLAKAEKPSKMFNQLMSTPINFTAFAMNCLQISDLTKANLVGPVYNLLKGTCKSFVELKYNMEECYKALNNKLDWNNPEGDRYPFDLNKPLPLGIEYMVPILWSPIKVAYDRHALLENYGSDQCQSYKWYGYGHLEEIEVRRSDQKLIFNLKGEDIVHLATTLRMFVRHIVIQKRAEDLQLGVKSYQKKLNISRPLTHKAGISDLEPYTPYYNPQGVIYLDKLERNRLMCTHELYKFSDGTLISVRDKLKDIANNLELWYSNAMPRMRWSNLEKKRSHIVVKYIDRQVLERMLLRSLEKFVGRREYGEDFRLL